MENIILNLANPKDIPTEWNRNKYKSKVVVRIRTCKKVETFHTKYGILTSDPNTDLIISSSDKEYPCKRDIFDKTYENIPGTFTYRKSYIATLVQVPQDANVNIISLEGKLSSVVYPDYIVIGPNDELYSNSLEFVLNNLELV